MQRPKEQLGRENGETPLKEVRTVFGLRMVILQALPMVGLGIYVFGFLATNTYLSKFGIYEFDLLSPRYVIVGMLYVVFVSFWYYFPGRSVLNAELNENYSEGEYTFRVRLEEWIELIFLVCVSASLFALIFLQSPETVFVCILAVIIRFAEPQWEDLWESRGLYAWFPVKESTVYAIMRALLIVVFFITVELDSRAMILFAQFLVMSIYGRFVVRVVMEDQDERKVPGNKTEEMSRSIAHVCAFAFLSAIAFGWLQYGQIHAGVGGGSAKEVEIAIVDKNTSERLEEMGFSVSPSFKGDLIYEDEGKIIVSTGRKTIEITNASIGGVQVFSAGSSGLELYAKSIWDEVKNKWRRLGLGTDRP